MDTRVFRCGRWFLALVVVAWAAPCGAADRVFDVRDFGAKPDGATLATKAIQSAIDACAASGGGRVVLGPGVYLSGTVVLKSRVTLWLEPGSTLRGSGKLDDYPQHKPAVRSYTDEYVDRSLIAGENLDDVAICGRGTIDGGGEHFRWSKYLTRPYVIRLVNCRGVLVEGVTMRNSPMWMQHYLACDRVMLRGLTVVNLGGANNDGLDVDGCRYVTVSDCIFDSDDDAITLKSTLDRPCENVVITNCVAASRCNPIKLGTESNGGFKNIAISNCTIAPPHHTQDPQSKLRGLAGIALEIVDGGTLDRLMVSNIAMTGVNVPIFLRWGDRARPFERGGPKPGKGSFRNVVLSGILATGASRTGCSIAGLPGQRIENVILRDVRLGFDGGGKAAEASRSIPEVAEKYPESSMFGTLPAYGLYARHVKGLKLLNVEVETAAPDARHALVCDDVEDLAIEGFEGRGGADALARIRLADVRGALIRGCQPGAAKTFLRVEGAKSRRIVLAGNDTGAVEKVFDAAAEVPAGALLELGKGR